MGTWHDVASAEGVGAEPRMVLAGTEMVMLIHDGERWHACQAICPHKFTSLEGAEIQGGHLTCPLHAACFNLETGQPLPDQAWAGVLTTYPVKVEDGRVWVEA